jgi:NAD(P)-dependent dehydrogenase (short-subunit alcohol dehydrogenase family)
LILRFSVLSVQFTFWLVGGALATWFITGAARGLGYEIALHALEAGANVVATARSLSEVEAAFAATPGFSERLQPVALDVTHESQAMAAV